MLAGGARAGSTALPRRWSRNAPLAQAAPALAAEWSPANEAPGPDEVLAGSQRRVAWRCARGHEWRATVASRVYRGSGCPYCSGLLVTPERRLSVTHPELVAEWDADVNADLTPDEVSAGSRAVVGWRCTAGHRWRARVAERTIRGCPRCAAEARIGTPQRRWPSLLEAFPGDPRHVWRARIVSRTRGRPTGCPYCSHRRTLPEESFAALHPDLAAELDPERNVGLDPYALAPGSTRAVWWRCRRDPSHGWRARPLDRVSRRSGCPLCAGRNRPPGPVPETEVLTAGEVAHWLGHSPAYVRHAAAAGRLPALKADRRWHFLREELLALRR